MQKYRSSESQTLNGHTSDEDRLLQPARLRSRSSLDTFLVPNRIRIPSNKPDAIDLEVAQALLKPITATVDMTHPATIPLQAQHGGGASKLQHVRMRSESSEFEESTGKSIYRLNLRAHNIPNSDLYTDAPQATVFKPQFLHRRRHRGSSWSSKRSNTGRPSTISKSSTFDGSFEPTDTRMSSSTYSRISHRTSIGASASLRNHSASYFNQQYNDLAVQHDLPSFPLTKKLPSDKCETHVRSSKHSHGWLRRKLIPRHSMTFTYKMKTTVKPLSRKKSFANISILRDKGHQDIFHGKSLEETCRLGGTGMLLLPMDFAIGKLMLPISLSAMAWYLLKNGVNAPGLFRISGQTSTVNALYEHYSHQFYDAGSPSKVQETIMSNELPAHIDYVVADIASVFKKILNGLPGGLLGSIELFEVLQVILCSTHPPGTKTGSDERPSQAELVALIILSISSRYRACLIQAFFGLLSLLADEAGKARVSESDWPRVPGANGQGSPNSELMGVHAFGVCLGPLLIGDLVDQIRLEEDIRNKDTLISREIPTRMARKRVSISSLKHEKASDLTTARARANLLSEVVIKLILSWKDIVHQLRIALGSERQSIRAESSDAIKTCFMNGMALGDSDEERIILDLLRAGRISQDTPVDTTVEQRIRSRSRGSPLPKSSKLTISEGREQLQPRQTSTPSKQIHDAYAAGTLLGLATANTSAIHDQTSKECVSLPHHAANVRPAVASAEPAFRNESHGLEEKQPDNGNVDSRSGDSLEAQVELPVGSGNLTARPPQRLKDENNISKIRVPTGSSSSSPSSSSPNNPRVPQELFTMDLMGRQHKISEPILHMDCNHPDVKSAPVEPYGPTQEDDEFLLRKEQSVRVLSDPFLNDHHVGEFGHIAGRAMTANDNQSQKSQGHSEAYELAAPYTDMEASTSESVLPKRSVSSSPTRQHSLIPKPIEAVGRIRKQQDLSQSFSVGGKDDRSFSTRVAKLNSSPIQASPASAIRSHEEHTGPTQDFEVSTTRPLSAYTISALQRAQAQAEQPGQLEHTQVRSTSRDRHGLSRDDANKTPLSVRRSGSANATLYAQIAHLQRQLELRDEEIQSTKRSLEAAIITHEDGQHITSSDRSSWGKGTLSRKVMQLTREMESWRDRAEWAERRLMGFAATAPKLNESHM